MHAELVGISSSLLSLLSSNGEELGKAHDSEESSNGNQNHEALDNHLQDALVGWLVEGLESSTNGDILKDVSFAAGHYFPVEPTSKGAVERNHNGSIFWKK